MLQTPALRLQSPTVSDVRIMLAAASDPQAQRWLGWPSRAVLPERVLERRLARPAARGLFLSRRYQSGPQSHLVAINLADGTVAGAIAVNRNTGEMGGWLAPRFRGRGLGAGLFAGATEFAHQHLGIHSVIAGTQSSHAACIAALAGAGFTPTAGPDVHTLPNRQVVPSRWFVHKAARPTKCGN